MLVDWNAKILARIQIGWFFAHIVCVNEKYKISYYEGHFRGKSNDQNFVSYHSFLRETEVKVINLITCFWISYLFVNKGNIYAHIYETYFF
jgi:hypothetical protein